jgi:hypothetical protein
MDLLYLLLRCAYVAVLLSLEVPYQALPLEEDHNPQLERHPKLQPLYNPLQDTHKDQHHLQALLIQVA